VGCGWRCEEGALGCLLEHHLLLLELSLRLLELLLLAGVLSDTRRGVVEAPHFLLLVLLLLLLLLLLALRLLLEVLLLLLKHVDLLRRDLFVQSLERRNVRRARMGDDVDVRDGGRSDDGRGAVCEWVLL